MDQSRGLAQDLDDKQDITRGVTTDVYEGGGTRAGGAWSPLPNPSPLHAPATTLSSPTMHHTGRLPRDSPVHSRPAFLDIAIAPRICALFHPLGGSANSRCYSTHLCHSYMLHAACSLTPAASDGRAATPAVGRQDEPPPRVGTLPWCRGVAGQRPMQKGGTSECRDASSRRAKAAKAVCRYAFSEGQQPAEGPTCQAEGQAALTF
jgi:hypothetical protein